MTELVLDDGRHHPEVCKTTSPIQIVIVGSSEGGDAHGEDIDGRGWRILTQDLTEFRYLWPRAWTHKNYCLCSDRERESAHKCHLEGATIRAELVEERREKVNDEIHQRQQKEGPTPPTRSSCG